MTNPEPTGSTSSARDPNSASTASNRASIPPTSHPPDVPRDLREVLGIDWLSLSVPISSPGPELDHADRADFHNEGSVRSTRKLTFQAEGITVRLRVAPGRDGWVAKVEFNPSEFCGNPDPTRALPTPDLPAAVAAVWWPMQEFVAPKVAMSEATVIRIDVARDFEVEPVAQVALLKGLHRVPVPYAKFRPLFSSTRGVPETLYAGTRKQGMVRIYDRHAKDRSLPVGVLRVEVEARTKWALRYGGIETVADISPSTVTDLFVNRFEWSGTGLPVIYEQARLKRLWGLTEDPATKVKRLDAIRFAGVERLQRAGIDVPEGNSAISARNALSAALGASHDSLDAPEIIRLDPHFDRPVRSIAA